MPTYAPLAGDMPLLRDGVVRLCVERLGLAVTGEELNITHDCTWRQCTVGDGTCAHHYAGRGGTRRDCDLIISMHNLRVDVGLTTEVRGWAYAYSPAEKFNAAEAPTDSTTLDGYYEFDLWVHYAGAPYVTRLARRIRGGRITLARRDHFNGTAPTALLGFTHAEDNARYVSHPYDDPAW